MRLAAVSLLCAAVASCSFAKPQVGRDAWTWADKAAGAYLASEACGILDVGERTCHWVVVGAVVAEELTQVSPCLRREWCPRWYDRFMDVATPWLTVRFSYYLRGR